MTQQLSLSYSGSSTLQACERKYCLRYLARVQTDPDYVNPDYFAFGNAFHKVLELTRHDPKQISKINFRDIITSYKLEYVTDGARISAMLRRYWELHLKYPLNVVATETKVTAERTNGVIDAIMSDDFGNWWIVDLKTTGKLDPALPARIAKDTQLNLYASFAEQLAHQYSLDVNMFAGIRYREALKPLQVYKAGESFESYTQRCETGTKVREIIVPIADLDVEESLGEFYESVKKADAIQATFIEANALVGKRNYGNCLAYGKPCEFFSWCHHKTYTEAIHSTQVIVCGDKGVELTNVPEELTHAPSANSFDEFI